MKKKVLVIDDTKNILMMLTKCLELEGYEVMTASNGKRALEMFQSHSFDLAFLDIKLPEVRGTEVLKRIRAIGITTPVIIITAYATVKNAVDCTNLGAVAYVQKPFSADKIRSIIKELDLKPGASNQTQPVEDSLHRIQGLIDNHSYDKALEASKRALSQDVGNAGIYRLIAECYEGLGNKDAASRFHECAKLFQN